MLIVSASFSYTFATRVVEVKVVDKDYLAVYFKDGKVAYRDDGTGPSAYTGHDFAPGDDQLIAFGKELDLKAAVNPSSWRLYSSDDSFYGKNGRQPIKLYRKSKVNNTDHAWNYKLDHWIYIKLPKALQERATYRLSLAPEMNADKAEIKIARNIFNNRSDAIHVNMIGYNPGSPVKSADLYAWMGDGGARDYRDFEGKQVWLYNVKTREKHKVGNVEFWKKSAKEASGRNLIGSDVWNVDFSSFDQSGTYRLVVEDVGCSLDFDIKPNVFFEPYKTSVRGYYYMRIGEDQMDMEPVPRRPLFIPKKDPEGFTIYITDLDPFDAAWNDHPGDTWDEPHFKPAKASMFWQRRLPGNPTNANGTGGHSDALDWDRHLAHVSNIYDLLLPYLLSNGQLNEDNLEIAESGNGIPDIIDEARNEVDFWLSLRNGDAYAHGLTNPSSEKTIMFQAGTTTMAAWANAANCAMIAECFRISGHNDLQQYYQKEGLKAFEFAKSQENQQLDDLQDIGDAVMRGRDYKMMTAAFLFNLTGDRQWEDILVKESVVKDKAALIIKKDRWTQIWGTAAYLLSPHEQNYPELVRNMKAAISDQAMDHNVKYMNIRPSRRSSNNNWWQTAQNLHLVILAHRFADNKDDKARYEKAMVLEADYGLGRNPSNIVEMTGLGEKNIVNCYTTGRNDGFPGLHPGHTPYNNLDPWGGSHNGGNPRWFSDRGYPDWDEGGWPHQEAHFNCRYSWANGEFTPRQTMRGKMALYGYLHSIYSFE